MDDIDFVMTDENQATKNTCFGKMAPVLATLVRGEILPIVETLICCTSRIT